MNETTSAEKGFVFCVSGAKYVEEARICARTIRRFHQEPIVLITDAEVSFPEFDQVIVQGEFARTYGAKIAMRHAPFERYICMDCDCRVIGPMPELFELLDVFDIALPAALGGYHYQLEGCSPAFREHSTHLIAVRKNKATDAFFLSWLDWYRRLEGEMQGEGDQRSFRRAAYSARDLRLCTLSDEWALSPYPGGLLCADVRVVHGRPVSRLDWLEKYANEKLGYRAVIAPFPPLYAPPQMEARDWLRLAASGAWEFLKAVNRDLRKARRPKA